MRKASLFAAASALGSVAFLISSFGAQAEGDEAIELDPTIVPFVEKYCADCHNTFLEEGDRNFDDFIASPVDPAHHHTLEEMLEQLNLGKMPKIGADVPQPSDDERRAVVAAMTDYLIASAVSKNPQETPLRRLTNLEYQNTLRDLFGHDPRRISTISSLPADANSHGFFNIGEKQAMSLAQLQAYINVADEVIERSYSKRGQTLTPVTSQRFGPRDFISSQRYPIRVALVTLVAGEDGTFFDILGGRQTADNPVFPLTYREQGGAPSDGIYTVRFTAEALDRYFDYGLVHPNGHRAGAILKLGIGTAPDVNSLRPSSARERVIQHVIDLPDDGPQEFEVRIKMEKGNVPFIFWPNGYHVSHYEIRENAAIHFPDIYKRFYDADNLLARDETGERHPDFLNFVRHVWKQPRIRMHDFEISGPYPLDDEAIFGIPAIEDYTSRPAEDLDDILVEFSSKAFRRPTTIAEIGSFRSVVNNALDDGRDWDSALKLGFAAILSSPRFLYLQEGNTEVGKALAPYELASRLSYFLWSSMPDQALLDDAASGALLDDKVLEGHVARMLKDKRSSAFVAGFTNSWLRLDKLGQMPPDPQIYWSAYYKTRLEEAMRNETELFFSYILRKNLAPVTFLEAKYTFLNDALATHYNVEGDFGEEFKLAVLPDNSMRRGITSHASVLTASANGVETSPVVRGVWLLENILGTPPSPPPPDVPPIEPDTRGATSIRELLAKHRTVQTCADCHAYIDPYGFPLEVFGPTGELRKNYPGVRDGQPVLEAGIPIDASTSLVTGEKIETMDDFHGVLLSKRRNFEINLMSKLLVYGTGREMTFKDRPEVESMVEELNKRDGGFLDMVMMAVTSDVFLTR